MKQILKLSCLIYVFLTVACQPKSNLIMDIPKVIDKSPADVKDILGEPDSVNMQPILNKEILTYYYTEHLIEFRFFNGHASEIVIRKTASIPFDPASLSLFGIIPSVPEDITPNMLIRWSNYKPFETITFYTKHRNVDGRPDVYEIFFRGRKG